MAENIPSSVKDKTYRFRILKHKRYRESHQGHHSRVVKQQKDLGISKKKKKKVNSELYAAKTFFKNGAKQAFSEKWKQRMQLADPHEL